MSVLETVIFDMDGLLADTEPLSYRAWAALLARDWGVTPTADDEAWATVTVGKSGPEVWALIGTRFGLPFDLPRDIPTLEGEYRAIYHDVIARGVPPMPGAIELVHACHEAGLCLGVASSSTMAQIEVVLGGLGLRPCFTALTSGHEVPRSKPDPAIYRLACTRLGADPARTVALEDSGPGITAAHGAGLRCLAVPSDYTAGHDFSLASAIVPSLVGVGPADLAALPWPGARDAAMAKDPEAHHPR